MTVEISAEAPLFSIELHADYWRGYTAAQAAEMCQRALTAAGSVSLKAEKKKGE